MTSVSQTGPTPGHDAVESAERRWSAVCLCIIVLLVFLATFAGVRQASLPQARLETVDPRTLHVTGEFIESNLGSAIEPDGSVTVRIVGQQYSLEVRPVKTRYFSECLGLEPQTHLHIGKGYVPHEHYLLQY